MNEEELFCKLFPEYAVNGKPLSPYFDLFESGYEQAEKRIEELEKENAETKERIKTLEYRCENIKDTDTMELVALQRENAELQHKVDTLQGFLDRDVEFNSLQKENAELKTRVENQKSFLERIRAKFELGEIDRKEIEGYLESEQLTNAKELLKRWLRLYNTNTVKGIITDTEQFLNSEVEK